MTMPMIFVLAACRYATLNADFQGRAGGKAEGKGKSEKQPAPVSS